MSLGEAITGVCTAVAKSRVVLDRRMESLLERAWDVSRAHHGNRFSLHVPGMFVVNGARGKYRAVSITGDRCDLDCEHCKGFLLKTMPHATGPDMLVALGLEAADRGDHGMLVTGGCDTLGRLPWKAYVPAIRKLKEQTDLTISVHAGMVDRVTATALKDSGVDQALVDVVGDDVTAREVYHLPEGIDAIRRTMESLTSAGLEVVPHIVFGIHYGERRGEAAALNMLKNYPIRKYVVVVIMPFRGTPMARIQPPTPEQVAEFMAWARLEIPHVHACLGCARPRGHYRWDLDALAVRAGVNSLALPSDVAVEEARKRGLELVYRETCCSVG